tara:strand:+ start:531 stop:1283 length:753 start_codon:yes stop_codon:yes gene_type:complete
MDFTLKKYKELLKVLIKNKYNFQTFDHFIRIPKNKTIVLRHDVDLMPENSLRFAKIQHEYGIKGVYYFRAVKESWDERIIKEIHEMGHEIGYHYENLTFCKGKYEQAIIDFEDNLTKLRRLAPVSTICMHGSPMSKYDSKDLWKRYDYKNFGIIGEPYFDTDFNNVFYLTDTGRRWDGDRVSVRDKVNSIYKLSFSTTNDVIQSIIKKELPNRLMFTFHPQRWHDNYFNWTKELLYQNFKNQVKRLFYVK